MFTYIYVFLLCVFLCLCVNRAFIYVFLFYVFLCLYVNCAFIYVFLFCVFLCMLTVYLCVFILCFSLCVNRAFMCFIFCVLQVESKRSRRDGNRKGSGTKHQTADNFDKLVNMYKQKLTGATNAGKKQAKWFQ